MHASNFNLFYCFTNPPLQYKLEDIHIPSLDPNSHTEIVGLHGDYTYEVPPIVFRQDSFRSSVKNLKHQESFRSGVKNLKQQESFRSSVQNLKHQESFRSGVKNLKHQESFRSSVKSLKRTPALLAPPTCTSVQTRSIEIPWPITPELFREVFPFHILFDHEMVIQSRGRSIAEFLPESACPSQRMHECFEIERPIVEFDYEGIRTETHNPFVLRFKPKAGNRKTRSNLKLRGQMVPVCNAPDASLLFLCSPHVSTFEQLRLMGLSLDSIPCHDVLFDFLQFNSYFHDEVSISDQLERAKDELEMEKAKLQQEKARTDSLLQMMLPAKVISELESTGAASTTGFPVVSILFSGITNFQAFCGICSAMDVVTLLNSLFSRFDDMIERYNVYKVRLCYTHAYIASVPGSHPAFRRWMRAWDRGYHAYSYTTDSPG